MILLSLAGVRAADIADDYARSDGERIVRLQRSLGLPPDNTKTEEIYAAAGTSSAAAIAEVIASIDAPAVLTAGGLSDADQERARARLLA